MMPSIVSRIATDSSSQIQLQVKQDAIKSLKAQIDLLEASNADLVTQNATSGLEQNKGIDDISTPDGHLGQATLRAFDTFKKQVSELQNKNESVIAKATDAKYRQLQARVSSLRQENKSLSDQAAVLDNHKTRRATLIKLCNEVPRITQLFEAWTRDFTQAPHTQALALPSALAAASPEDDPLFHYLKTLFDLLVSAGENVFRNVQDRHSPVSRSRSDQSSSSMSVDQSSESNHANEANNEQGIRSQNAHQGIVRTSASDKAPPGSNEVDVIVPMRSNDSQGNAEEGLGKTTSKNRAPLRVTSTPNATESTSPSVTSGVSATKRTVSTPLTDESIMDISTSVIGSPSTPIISTPFASGSQANAFRGLNSTSNNYDMITAEDDTAENVERKRNSYPHGFRMDNGDGRGPAYSASAMMYRGNGQNGVRVHSFEEERVASSKWKSGPVPKEWMPYSSGTISFSESEMGEALGQVKIGLRTPESLSTKRALEEGEPSPYFQTHSTRYSGKRKKLQAHSEVEKS